MTNDPTDPPMTPQDGTASWVETDRSPIVDTPARAVLMVRVGMAANALNAQLDTVRHMDLDQGARRSRNVLVALIGSAAILNESVQLARENMAELRSLVQRTHAKPQLLARMGRLAAGNDPASPLLKAARNKLGFHWDADFIQLAVREFARNQVLIWLESDSEGHPVHRLSCDVLAHALFPIDGDDEVARQKITKGIEQIVNAMDVVIEFFTASTYGYFRVCSAVRHERDVAKT